VPHWTGRATGWKTRRQPLAAGSGRWILDSGSWILNPEILNPDRRNLPSGLRPRLRPLDRKVVDLTGDEAVESRWRRRWRAVGLANCHWPGTKDASSRRGEASQKTGSSVLVAQINWASPVGVRPAQTGRLKDGRMKSSGPLISLTLSGNCPRQGVASRDR
jgi:hypothetical protein